MGNAMPAASSQANGRRKERILLLLAVLVVLLAIFMRVYRLGEVPPGIHYDEILNAEIAERALREGPQFFYDTAGGREGLYHLLLTASFALPLPEVWQLRLPSVVFSLAGLFFTYLWVSRAFGRWAALTAAGLMAVSFWTVWMGRAALRVGTVTPIAALAAYFLILHLKQESDNALRSRLMSLVLGVVVGVSFYTYRAGSLVVLVHVLFTVYLFVWHRAEARKMVLSLAVAIIVAAPMILLFATRPETDPRFPQIAVPWHALMNGDPLPALQGVVDNIGMFFWRGDLEGHYNLPGRPIFEPLGAILFVIGLGMAIWRWRQPLYAFSLLWLAAGLLPGIFTLPAPSFVHTVTAQGITYVFPGIAVVALVERAAEHRSGLAQLAVPLLVLVLIGVNSVWTYVDYFHRWPRVAEVQGFHQSDLALIAAQLDARAMVTDVAICSVVLNEEDSFWRSGRQTIPYLLNRENVTIRWYDCGSALVLPHSDEPATYYFPNDSKLRAWLLPPGENLTASESLDVGVTGMVVDVSGWQQALLEDAAQPEPNGLPVQFGEGMAFLGYSLDELAVTAGEEVALRTYWRVTGRLPLNLSVFVHLLDGSGNLIAQGDAFSMLSDTLVPGDMVVQLHRFSIPADAAAGTFPLSVGVYSRTGETPPWPVIVEGQPQEPRLILSTMQIERSQ